MYDACANRQKLKCLTVVDEYTRECLAIDVSGTIRSLRVIDILSRLMLLHGVPRYLRSDNGPEFVSKALLEWATKEPLQLALIDPGKPGRMVQTRALMASLGTNVCPWSGFAIESKRVW